MRSDKAQVREYMIEFIIPSFGRSNLSMPMAAAPTRHGARQSFPMRERRKAEMAGDRLSHVGECRAAAEVARRDVRAEPKHRHLLAGVVGARPGRIAAVIGGDIARSPAAAARDKFRQPRVERFERRRIAGHVAAMPVERVEIDEIGEHQAAVGRHGVASRASHRTRPVVLCGDSCASRRDGRRCRRSCRPKPSLPPEATIAIEQCRRRGGGIV